MRTAQLCQPESSEPELRCNPPLRHRPCEIPQPTTKLTRAAPHLDVLRLVLYEGTVYIIRRRIFDLQAPRKLDELGRVKRATRVSADSHLSPRRARKL